jgi:hypothetical protein
MAHKLSYSTLPLGKVGCPQGDYSQAKTFISISFQKEGGDLLD